MLIRRKRLYYLILVLVVIVVGLLSREIPSWLPKWIGDILWGLMVFFIMGFIFRDRPILNNAILSAIFSIGIEVAKFYHAPWIDTFRYTIIGGLILGYVFSFYNILCYITGIAIGVTCEKLGINNSNKE
ncbi:MAG: hypothetical protein H6Q73_2245 [Firmicutes bacterium]|nr:hypothetical protein [Bacillota bacterium]